MLLALAALWLTAAPGRVPAPGRWQTSGPAYPLVEAIAFVPGDETVVYAAARNPVAGTSGLFRSEDGGLTWILLAQAPSQESVRQLAIDPTGSQRMLALTATAAHDVVYRSDDGGFQWRQTKIFRAQGNETFFFDPVAADTAYLLAGGLTRSENGGAWEDVGSARSAWVTPEGTLYWVESVYHPPPIPYPFPEPGSHDDEIFVSGTQGLTSRFVASTVCLDFESVAYAPSDAPVVYATAPGCEALLVSFDRGAHWTAVASSDLAAILEPAPGGQALQVARIAVDPRDAATIFLTVVSSDGAGGHLLRSDDGGAGWKTVPVPEPPTGPLAIGPSSRLLYLGTSQGVFRLSLDRTQILPPR